jgi:CTP:molybdopterin cytidylyltransferase MocA
MVAVSGAELVVLAAGRSSRLGIPKGLVEVKGQLWLELQLEAARVAGVSRAIVVLNRESEPLYLASVPSLRRGTHVVINEDPDRGSFSSLLCGLGVVSAAAPAFVLPVDVPAAKAEVWSDLAAALRPGVDAAVPLLEGEGPGRGGHPVLLGASFIAHLRSLPAEAARTARLDHLLEGRRRLQSVTQVTVRDESVRLNLNTPSDWEKVGVAIADGTRSRYR